MNDLDTYHYWWIGWGSGSDRDFLIIVILLFDGLMLVCATFLLVLCMRSCSNCVISSASLLAVSLSKVASSSRDFDLKAKIGNSDVGSCPCTYGCESETTT